MLINRNRQRRNSSGEKSVSPSHQFAVGQTVRLSPDLKGSSLPSENFRIVAHLPLRDNFPQYRIRNLNEPHERVITEDKLAKINETDPNHYGSLVNKIFGSNK